MADEALKLGVPFFRLVQNPEKVPGIPEKVRTALRGFYAMLEEYRGRVNEPGSDLGALCRALTGKIDFRNAFTRTDRQLKRVAQRMDNLEEVAVALDSFRERNPDGRLDDYRPNSP